MRILTIITASVLLVVSSCRNCEEEDLGYAYISYFGTNTGEIRDGGLDRPTIGPGQSAKRTHTSGSRYVEICVNGGECFGQQIQIDQCETTYLDMYEPCYGQGYGYINVTNNQGTDRWVIIDNDNALDALVRPGKTTQFKLPVGNHTIYSKVPGTWVLLDSLSFSTDECGIQNWPLSH